MRQLLSLRFHFHYLPFVALVALLLTACSTPSPTPFTLSQPTPGWQQHQQDMQLITRYSARGVFGYIAGNKRISANFFWQQEDPQHYRLLLTNPFGGTELDLRAKPGLVEVTDNKGENYVDTDVDSMILQLTGMSVPLQNMRTWMMGLPNSHDRFQLTDNDLLAQLITKDKQQRWQVIYQSYHQQTRLALPKQMEIIQEGNLKIKLRIDSWTLP